MLKTWFASIIFRQHVLLDDLDWIVSTDVTPTVLETNRVIQLSGYAVKVVNKDIVA